MTQQFSEEDVAGAAHAYVRRVINRQLYEGQVSAQLGLSPESTQDGLYLVPGSLLGALWLQFAQSLSEGREHRRCKFCGTWFEVGLDAWKTTKLYCGDPCRMKNYRHGLKKKRSPSRSVKKQLERDSTARRSTRARTKR